MKWSNALNNKALLRGIIPGLELDHCSWGTDVQVVGPCLVLLQVSSLTFTQDFLVHSKSGCPWCPKHHQLFCIFCQKKIGSKRKSHQVCTMCVAISAIFHPIISSDRSSCSRPLNTFSHNLLTLLKISL